MPTFKGLPYLRNQLNQKRTRVLTRYSYYDMKNGIKYLRSAIPVQMMWMAESLGWCAKAVDALADRLSLREFRDDNFNISEIYRMNNFDILPDSAILSAMISSCSFLYLSPDASGYPRMQVIDGGNATGDIDPITGLLSEGYAVLKRKVSGSPDLEAYFLPDRTEYWQDNKRVDVQMHNAGHPLLVPIIYRPDASRPFGRSRISRSCMGLQQGALRTLLRSEVSAEFYAFPQKWISGMSPDAEEIDKWKATITSILTLTKDEDGDSPKLGQFTQMSQQPHLDQMRTFASLFAGETGLTLDDLGFPTDNPSSAEAIKAAHENLRLTARKAQKTLGSGFINAGYLAACLRDQFPYARQEIYKTIPVWEPVFEPDAATLSAIGDGAIKINQAVPGYFGAESLHDLTGIKPQT